MQSLASGREVLLYFCYVLISISLLVYIHECTFLSNTREKNVIKQDVRKGKSNLYNFLRWIHHTTSLEVTNDFYFAIGTGCINQSIYTSRTLLWFYRRAKNTKKYFAREKILQIFSQPSLYYFYW